MFSSDSLYYILLYYIILYYMNYGCLFNPVTNGESNRAYNVIINEKPAKEDTFAGQNMK